jgi:hypothetical protein
MLFNKSVSSLSKFSVRNSSSGKINVKRVNSQKIAKARAFSIGRSINPGMKIDSEEKTLFLNKLKLVLACYYLLLEIKFLLRENSIVVTDLPDDLKIA